MIANGKILITVQSGPTDTDLIEACDENGCTSRIVIADAIVQIVELSDFSLFELRIIVPRVDAEEMVVGMMKGQTEISMSKISPTLDPN